MATINTKQVLSDLYGLMMEINYHRTDDEVLEDLRHKDDPQLENHLLRMRQISTRLKAQKNRERFQMALEQIRVLKEKGLDELKKFVSAQEQSQLVPLFRKFEELTKEDEAAILEDQELLHLLEVLINKIDDNP